MTEGEPRDGKTPRILRIEDLGKEDPEGEGPALVTEDRAVRERGKLNAADYSVMASAAHGEGARVVSPHEFWELATQADETHRQLLDLVRGGMKRRHARYVRQLRLANHSWRSIADLCFNRGWAWASWAPPSNQLAGMALCERAAELQGEDYMKEPWN